MKTTFERMNELEERLEALEKQMGHTRGPKVVNIPGGLCAPNNYEGKALEELEELEELAPVDAEGVKLGEGWMHNCATQQSMVTVYSEECSYCGDTQHTQAKEDAHWRNLDNG